MTNGDNSVNPGGLAALKNVSRFLVLMETLINRGPHLPGIGVFHGYSGYGKTYAALYVQNITGALRVEVGDSWTKKKFLQMLLEEAGIDKPRGRTIADLTEEAIEVLGDDPGRPLFIDEADKLADKGMLELVREIHEHSQAPIVLIGEEQLPGKILKVERVHNRVLDWVPAEPCDHDDARALADFLKHHLRAHQPGNRDTRLKKAGVPQDDHETVRLHMNRLANLQLLEGEDNKSKSAKMPAKWLETRFKSDADRAAYRERHDLGVLPSGVEGFEAFYKARRARMKERLTGILHP